MRYTDNHFTPDNIILEQLMAIRNKETDKLYISDAKYLDKLLKVSGYGSLKLAKELSSHNVPININYDIDEYIIVSSGNRFVFMSTAAYSVYKYVRNSTRKLSSVIINSFSDYLLNDEFWISHSDNKYSGYVVKFNYCKEYVEFYKMYQVANTDTYCILYDGYLYMNDQRIYDLIDSYITEQVESTPIMHMVSSVDNWIVAKVLTQMGYISKSRKRGLNYKLAVTDYPQWVESFVMDYNLTEDKDKYDYEKFTDIEDLLILLSAVNPYSSIEVSKVSWIYQYLVS